MKERQEDIGVVVKEWTALVSQRNGTGRDTVVERLREGRDAENGGMCASITTGPPGNEPGASTLRCHHTSGNHSSTFGASGRNCRVENPPVAEPGPG